MSAGAPASARLLVTCADRPGIVAAVTSFLFQKGANITDLDQHSSDPSGGQFFLRLEFQLAGVRMPVDALRAAFAAEVATRFAMEWRLNAAECRPQVALLVSRTDHCLMELLWRWSRGELAVDIPVVVSNHSDLRAAVEGFGIRYVQVAHDGSESEVAEAQMQEALGNDVDLVVLARYMRVLSPGFVGRYAERMINIHHSFLPAFQGGNPYGQAYAQGVKLIGATAHYVTAELDRGPIIEQDTARVTHRFDLDDLKQLGRDLERQVLARAVRWHVEDRIIVDGNKTIVFS